MQADYVDVSIHVLNGTLEPFDHGDGFFNRRVKDCPLDVDVAGPGRQVGQLQDEPFQLRMELEAPGYEPQASPVLGLDELCAVGFVEE